MRSGAIRREGNGCERRDADAERCAPESLRHGRSVLGGHRPGPCDEGGARVAEAHRVVSIPGPSGTGGPGEIGRRRVSARGEVPPHTQGSDCPPLADLFRFVSGVSVLSVGRRITRRSTNLSSGGGVFFETRRHRLVLGAESVQRGHTEATFEYRRALRTYRLVLRRPRRLPRWPGG